MNYDYQTERSKIFTEDGQKTFLSIRDRVKRWLAQTGALTIGAAIHGETGDSWFMLACVDRLEELGEIKILHLEDRMTQEHIIIGSRK